VPDTFGLESWAFGNKNGVQKRKRSGVETKMERPGSLGLLEKVLHSGLERNIQAEIECGSRIWGKIDPGSIQGGVDVHSEVQQFSRYSAMTVRCN
jgi:hypothetical protein